MSNILAGTTQQQIEGLGRLGWSLRKIKAATGVRREMISGYLTAAGIAVRRRGERVADWPPPNPATTPPVSTDSSPADPMIGIDVVPDRAPTASACEPYRDLIVEALGRGRNAMAIWQDLVDGHGFTGRYASVRRFARAQRATAPPEPSGIITTAPGEECRVDCGEGPMVRHPDHGRYVRTRLFVMTLGCSRKSVRLLTWRSSSQRWAELHEDAFRRLGGSPRVVVLDNLREGVRATGQRFGCRMISAIANRGNLVFRVFHGTSRAPMCVHFMRRLRLQSKGTIYLIVDGHPLHRSKVAKAFVAANTNAFRLIQRPGYCPELNPDELLNQDVKTNALGKSRPRTRHEMRTAARRHLLRRQKQPRVIKNLFQKKHLRYAA